MEKENQQPPPKPTILTGIKNSGDLHIGSYLGAIKPMVDLQRREVITGNMRMHMFIPDLHSLTVPADYSQLQRHMIDNIKLYIACGLDPSDDNTLLYRQSTIPAHSQMCVLLNNFAYFGELSRQTQFKSQFNKPVVVKADNLESLRHAANDNGGKFDLKTESGQQGFADFGQNLREHNISVGMFDYPVLMAADILLYGAEYVPVGDDQRQHLELARDIADRVNNKFAQEIFVLPKTITQQTQFLGSDKALRIMSLSSPNDKMSKSVKDPRGTIDLLDAPDIARKKIMSAATDSKASVNYDLEAQPGVSNLIEIYASFRDISIADAEAEFKGSDRYGDLKTAVADIVCPALEQIQSKFADITDELVLEILESGEAQAAPIAGKTLLKLERSLKLKSKTQKNVAKPKSIPFSDFNRLDIRAGKVTSAEAVAGSDKLIELTVDIGEVEPRKVLTGMLEFYEPQSFVGNTYPILCNLEPKTIMGAESHGMLLAFDSAEAPGLIPIEHPAIKTGNQLK